MHDPQNQYNNPDILMNKTPEQVDLLLQIWEGKKLIEQDFEYGDKNKIFFVSSKVNLCIILDDVLI